MCTDSHRSSIVSSASSEQGRYYDDSRQVSVTDPTSSEVPHNGANSDSIVDDAAARVGTAGGEYNHSQHAVHRFAYTRAYVIVCFFSYLKYYWVKGASII